MTTTIEIKLNSFLDVKDDKRMPVPIDIFEDYLKLSMADTGVCKTDLDPEVLTADDAKSSPGIQLLHQRLEWANVKITKPLAGICLLLSRGIPGNIVMWAWTLKVMSDDKNGQILRVDDLVTAFPNGFPTEKGEIDVWDSQKGDPDIYPLGNKLDDTTIWKRRPTNGKMRNLSESK